MKFSLLILFLVLSSDYYQTISCLNSGDYCVKNEYSKNCMAHDCGLKFCTFDKQTCQDLIKYGIMIARNSFESKVFKTFIQSIKPCNRRMYRNQWSHRMNFG
jgi:hypothetical protein